MIEVGQDTPFYLLVNLDFTKLVKATLVILVHTHQAMVISKIFYLMIRLEMII